MRLRYSLGTLVLAVLLLASGATLWWNCRQWRAVATTRVPEFEGVRLLSDESRFAICTFQPDLKLKKDEIPYGTHTLTLFDARNGAQLRSISMFGMHWCRVEVTPNGDYVYLNDSLLFGGTGISEIKSIESGEPLIEKFGAVANLSNSHFLTESSRVLIYSKELRGFRLCEFPSLKTLREYPGRNFKGLCWANGGFVLDNGNTEIYRADGSLQKVIPAPPNQAITEYNGNYRQLLIHQHPQPVRYFDLKHIGKSTAQICIHSGDNQKLCLRNLTADSAQILPELNNARTLDDEYLYAQDSALNLKTNIVEHRIDDGFLGNGRIRVRRRQDAIQTVDLRTGGDLGTIPRYRWRDQFGTEVVQVFNIERAFITRDGEQFFLWRQVMANLWPGMLGMPEFWITAVLLAAVVWRIWRRIWRGGGAATPAARRAH